MVIVENDEMKARMFNNVLLVGGGLMFEGIESLLQYRLWLNLPSPQRQTANVTVLTRTKVRGLFYLLNMRVKFLRLFVFDLRFYHVQPVLVLGFYWEEEASY